MDPLLFILYMNDLPLHLIETQIDLYADYATQYVSGSNIQAVEENFTRDILPFIQWSKMNKMVLNERRAATFVVTPIMSISLCHYS